MKILIVDDEELTRTGVISSVDWKRLGIDEVYQADDGLNGLKKAAEVIPDIILCDVRMPRMDGITMLEKIEKSFPDIVAVFMSGYSDKEYLKAAIQLKAIDYIEKPIQKDELNETIRKAVERCRVIRLQNIAGKTHESVASSELAYRFTMAYRNNAKVIDELIEQFNGSTDFKYITTFIIKIKDLPEDSNIISDFYSAVNGYLKSMNLHAIYTEKKSYNIIFHIYGDMKPTSGTISLIANQMRELIDADTEYYISVGETVSGKENVYKSFSSAVVMLQRSFFLKPTSVIINDGSPDIGAMTLDRLRELCTSYKLSIETADKKKALNIIDELGMLRGSRGIMENQLKALYNDMLLQLYKERRRKNLNTDLSIENQETIMDIVAKCFCFDTLQQIIVEKTDSFFNDTEGEAVDNPTIRIICEYITDHYSSPDLSVKSISDYAALSTSYACTYFKNETGMTLNQYITDFRMKKAKQLLMDPRNKVNDISAAVGYNDGNYFTKSFRKYTGLSPSEYREQVIRT